jgi:PAS domain S-box-containing protein/diguanylate cyclase (GGDEF)-like protein
VTIPRKPALTPEVARVLSEHGRWVTFRTLPVVQVVLAAALGILWYIVSLFGVQGPTDGVFLGLEVFHLLWFTVTLAEWRHPRSTPLSFAKHGAALLIDAAVIAVLIVTLFPSEGNLLSVFLAGFYFALLAAGAFLFSRVPNLARSWCLVLGSGGFAAVLRLQGVDAFILGGALIGFVGLLFFVIGSLWNGFRDLVSAEQTAARRTEELRVIMDQSPVSIVITDLKGTILETNRKAQEESGYSREELLGQNPRILGSGNTSRATYDGLWAALARGDVWRGTFQNRRKDGSEYWEESIIAPLRDREGRVHRYLALKADISERIKVEEQNSLIKLLLHEFEENAGDWLWEVDRTGRMTRVSPRIASTLGLSAEELTARSLIEVLAERFPPGAEADRQAFLTAMQVLKLPVPFRDLEVKLWIGPGYEWMSLSGKPVFDAGGQYAGWRGVGREVTERRVHLEEIERQANIDPLTGLANRYALMRALQRSDRERSGAGVAALLKLAVANFTRLNTVYGSAAGEAILVVLARRLVEAIAAGKALVARTGESEFSVFFPDLPAADAETFHGLLAGLQAPVEVKGEPAELTLRTGLAFTADGTSDDSLLFEQSSLALAQAWESRYNGVFLFDEALALAANRQAGLLNELTRAIDRGELDVHYQPQVRASDGTPVGAEALVRWTNTKFGSVSPAELIPMAEASGLIGTIGTWVLRRACREAAAWPLPWRLSVNVSAAQVLSPSLVDEVSSALSDGGLDPSRLKLEITESALMADKELVLRRLQQLRALGVALSLDDFGTGYSSLSYLKDFPFDELKIDKSFVQSLDLEDHAGPIIQTILGLARNLNLSTTAEGVETLRQLQVLQGFGCDQIQGYWFSRPLPLAAFLAYQAREGGKPGGFFPGP